jgi:hypothetical protein
MNKIIFVEGARNVGKTFLLDKLDNDYIIYKFPFSQYFNELHTYNINEEKQKLNSDPKLFFLTLGYDITILDLASKGLLKQDLFVDRGIISDLVFGIQAGRINKEFAIVVLKWIIENYGDVFKILYITADNKTDERAKDDWNHYDKSLSNEIFFNLIKDINVFPYYFNNDFNNESIIRFKKCVSNITTDIIF